MVELSMHFGRASLLKLLPFVLAGVVAGLVASRLARGTPMSAVLVVLAVATMLAVVAVVLWMVVRNNRRVAVAAQVQRQDALQFVAPPGKGVLYLYRSQYVAMLAGFDVVLDGRYIGQTRGYRFYRLELDPGHHVLSGGRFCRGELAFHIQAGQLLFIEQEVQLGALLNQYTYVLREDSTAVRKRIHGLKMLLPVQD